MALPRFKKALTQFEEFAVDVVYERRRGKRAFLLGLFLRALSLLFSGVAQLR